MKCKHCNEEMAECVQPALLPTQQDIVLVTCQTDGCQMRGFTLSKATYEERDLTPYLKTGAA